MLEEKRRSENEWTEFYSSCPLFNKYRDYNFWFGSFDDYNNIIYCKKYMGKYICFLIHRYLLQFFSLSIVLVLYKSPRFIKFVESGFFRYLDFHFLLLFYNNSFSRGRELKIKFFVQGYFQKYIKEELKKDLLICISESINELTSNSFRLELASRLKEVSTPVRQMNFSAEILPCFVRYKTLKKSPFFSGLDYKYSQTIYFKFLVKACDNYESIPGYTTVVNSLYLKGFILNRFDKRIKYLKFNSGLKKHYQFGLEKNLGSIKKDIYDLVDFLIGAQVNIGLYKKTTLIFGNKLNTRRVLSEKPCKTFNKFVKAFDYSFFRCRDKKKLQVKPLTNL